MSQIQEKTVTITLDYPRPLADGQLASVTLRRPSLQNMLDNPQDGSLGSEVRLLSVLSGLNIEDLGALDFADYEKLQDQLLRFRGHDPAKLRKKDRV